MRDAALALCLLASASSFSSLSAANRGVHQFREVVLEGKHQIRHSLFGKRGSSCTIFASIRGGASADSSVDTNQATLKPQAKLESLLLQADELLAQKDANGAFALLAQAYPMDPASSQIASMFQKCMEININVARNRFNQWKDAKETEFTEGELTNLFQDRIGLASLCIDKEQYDQAGKHLRTAIEDATLWLRHALNTDQQGINAELPDLSSTTFQHWQPQIDQARYLLYRTNAACCKWDTYFQDGDNLRKSLRQGTLPSGHVVRLLHPFDALKFPCVSLELASKIAQSYAYRALESVGVALDSESLKEKQPRPRKVVTAVRSQEIHVKNEPPKKLRIGYLSPDFTSRHPLAFLMQHVFRCHDKSRFSVHIYSLSVSVRDEGPEVKAIRESSESFTYLSTTGTNPAELYQRILHDEIDILVDLCGYAGTSIVAEIMASRCKLQQDAVSNMNFPIHVAYMGFPGSIGSSNIWDYSVFDKHVVPLSLRKYYSGALVYMPHSYFVNSHKTVVGGPGDGVMLANEKERADLRLKYGLNPSSFVYCCHSRPDKIDPSTFRSWIRALSIARDEHKKKGVKEDALPVLWLLRSGSEMEKNLRSLVLHEFGQDTSDAVVFVDVAERTEHLRRLGCADVFLDTLAYGAHTLGVDALYMGVPMISLLPSDANANNPNNGRAAYSDRDLDVTTEVESRVIPTDKLASIVGSSLLHATSCDELIVHDMPAYENLMVKCATDHQWFESIRERLVSSRSNAPLFDTSRWVKNLEAAFLTMNDEYPDIVVTEE